MRRWRTVCVRVVLVAALVPALQACEQGKSAVSEDTPIILEEVEGETRLRLTLSESAAIRLDIATAEVEAASDGYIVPRSAVIIDTQGAYWVYANPKPRVFIRRQLLTVREADGVAYFAAGPEPGTLVVTRGVPELYGAEFGIGK